MNRVARERALDVGLDGSYTLEQVSNVAAHLLNGIGYSEAAKKALALLDACRHELQERRRREAAYAAGHAEALAKDAEALRDANGNIFQMIWREALKHIAGGEKREERSFPLFKAFIAYQFRASQAARFGISFEDTDVPADAVMNQRMDKYKAEGMDSRQASGYRKEFEKWKPTYKAEIAKRNASLKRKRQSHDANKKG